MYYLYLTSFVYINFFFVLHTDETMDELYAIGLELYALYNKDIAFKILKFYFYVNFSS